MKSNINIFGQKAYVTDFRIPAKDRLPELFYYGIRHSDTDMFEPSTIEGRVIVNFYGTLITEQKLDCLGLDFILLTDEQKQLIIGSIDGIEPPSAGVEMRDFRLTRNEIYNDPNCIGHNDIRARQGHYIREESEAEARKQMAEWYPNETFTCQEWDSSNGSEIVPNEAGNPDNIFSRADTGNEYMDDYYPSEEAV